MDTKVATQASTFSLANHNYSRLSAFQDEVEKNVLRFDSKLSEFAEKLETFELQYFKLD